MDFWLLINKVIHKKREQLWQLRLCGRGAGANDMPIPQINRMIEIELCGLRELPGDHELPTLLQPKNRVML